jgi:penicillin amidase
VATPQKETRRDIVLQSFKVIAESIRKKEFVEVHEPYGPDVPHKLSSTENLDWGKYKATKIEHLARIDAFSSLNVYNGGNLGVINATNSTNGPSWRMVVDFNERKAYTVYPGGQSGNPASRFYDNMVDTWAKGEYYIAAFFTEPLKKLFVETYHP